MGVVFQTFSRRKKKIISQIPHFSRHFQGAGNPVDSALCSGLVPCSDWITSGFSRTFCSSIETFFHYFIKLSTASYLPILTKYCKTKHGKIESNICNNNLLRAKLLHKKKRQLRKTKWQDFGKKYQSIMLTESLKWN